MTLILQTSGTGVCSVAPGADVEMATTLIRMSLVGIPLLLALFQFINDHHYDEWDEHLTGTTQLFGGAMILSSFSLLSMYYAGLCTINTTLPTSQLTVSISIFIVPIAVIIAIILYAQFKQMVQPGLRFGAWMVSIGIALGYIGVYVTMAGGTAQQKIIPYGLMVLFGTVGVAASHPRCQNYIRNTFGGDADDDEPEWLGIE